MAKEKQSSAIASAKLRFRITTQQPTAVYSTSIHLLWSLQLYASRLLKAMGINYLAYLD